MTQALEELVRNTLPFAYGNPIADFAEKSIHGTIKRCTASILQWVRASDIDTRSGSDYRPGSNSTC